MNTFPLPFYMSLLHIPLYISPFTYPLFTYPLFTYPFLHIPPFYISPFYISLGDTVHPGRKEPLLLFATGFIHSNIHHRGMDTGTEYHDLLSCRRFHELRVADTTDDLEALSRTLEYVSTSKLWDDVNYQVYFLYVLCASDSRIHLLRKYFPLPSSISLYETPFRFPDTDTDTDIDVFDHCDDTFCLCYCCDQGTLAIHYVCLYGSSQVLEYIICNTSEHDIKLLVQIDERNRTPLIYCYYRAVQTCTTTAPILVDEMARRGLRFSDATIYDKYGGYREYCIPITAVSGFISAARRYKDESVMAHNLISLVRRMLTLLTRQQWLLLEHVHGGPFIFDLVLVDGLHLFDFVVDKMKAIYYHVNAVDCIGSFSRFISRTWDKSWFNNVIDYFGPITLTFHAESPAGINDTIVEILLCDDKSQTTHEGWVMAKRLLDRVPCEVFFLRDASQKTFLHKWVKHTSNHTLELVLDYICKRVGNAHFLETDFWGNTVIHAAYSTCNTWLIEKLHSMFDEHHFCVVDVYGNTPFHGLCIYNASSLCYRNPLTTISEHCDVTYSGDPYTDLVMTMSFVASLTPKMVFTQRNKQNRTPRDILISSEILSESDVDHILAPRTKGAIL